MLLRHDQLWLPGGLPLRRRDSARVRTAFTRMRPVMAWLDVHTHARFIAFVHRPLIFVPQTLCVLSGLMMPFLEFVPFSSSLVVGAVALLAFGMSARDGLSSCLGLLSIWGPCGCRFTSRDRTASFLYRSGKSLREGAETRFAILNDRKGPPSGRLGRPVPHLHPDQRAAGQQQEGHHRDVHRRPPGHGVRGRPHEPP